MGSSKAQIEPNALQSQPCRTSTASVLGFRLLRCFFVTVSAVIEVGAVVCARPLLEVSADVQEIVLRVAGTIALGLLGLVLWIAQPMGPSFESQERCTDDEVASFSRTCKGWLLCQPAGKHQTSATRDTLFVLYCGAKLDDTHYTMLCKEIARHGISTLVLPARLNVCFFPPVDARTVIAAMSPTYNRFILGGHSLGAHSACQHAHSLSGKNELAGVVLIGSYVESAKPSNLSGLRGGDGALPVALVNATRDQLLLSFIKGNHKNSVEQWITRSRELLPAGACVRMIKDGNHFGYVDVTFGVLQGYPYIDNEALIPRDVQQKETARAVADVAYWSPSRPLPLGP